MRIIDAESLIEKYKNADGNIYSTVHFLNDLIAQPILEESEDCISRKDLLSALGEEPMNWMDTDSEIQAVNDYRDFVKLINSLPSVTPKPKVGKWINDGMGLYCSECNHSDNSFVGTLYCPNCGAKMEVEE